MIHSGMVNSNSVTMRAHVALVPILHSDHGSVWTSLTVQVMILRCAIVTVKMKEPKMKILQFICWSSLFINFYTAAGKS